MIKQLILLAMVANYTLSAQTWTAPVPAVNPNIGNGAVSGFYAKMILVNGNPAMANYSRDNLQYVRALDNTGTTWDTATTVDATSFSGKYLSMAVVNGNPAISYYDETGGNLKFVRSSDANGTTWGTPKNVDISGDVGKFTSMQLVNGNPAISYFDQTNGTLKFVRALDVNGISWGSPIVLDAVDVVGQYTSLGIINGKPAISYYDSTNGNLKYVSSSDASGSGGTWGGGTLDDLGDVGKSSSLQQVNGQAAIAYYEVVNSFFGINGYLKYISYSGGQWSTPMVLDGNGFNNVGEFPSLQIVNGNPAISYYDAGFNNNLKYIRCNDASGTIWASPVTVDASDQDAGRFSSLQVVNGNPAICYYDQTRFDMLYIRATDANGATWGNSLSFDGVGITGEYLSLQMVDGKPAISYFDGRASDYGINNYNLVYVRSVDKDGSRWGLRTVIDSIGDVGKYTSLQVVDGNPAISYVDDNGRVKYVRAIDVTGTVWGTPVVVDSFGSIAGHTSLQVINGRPAIAYHVAKYSSVSIGAIEGHLKYVQANDASGNTWGTPLNLAGQFNSSATFTFSYISLQAVNSKPGIAFFSFGSPGINPPDYYLQYMQAVDEDGTNWNPPIILDRGNTGGYTSLHMVKGKPAVSYATNNYSIPGSNNVLKYKRAFDADGAAWDTINISHVADNAANINSGTSLQIINGHPAIAYFDLYPSVNNTGRQKYVRAENDTGSVWGTPATLAITGGFTSYTSMISTATGAGIAYYNDSYPIQLHYYVKGILPCPDFNRWVGNISNVWENPANWSCGSLPGSTTNVIIDGGATVVINSNITINTLSLNPGASLQVNSGFMLTIIH